MIDIQPHHHDPREAIGAVRYEVSKVVVGQEGTLSGVVISLLVGGHVLLEGVPGVAKTLLVKAVAGALDLHFRRVQFTPDLMPSDITGQSIYQAAEGSLKFRPGPVFTNLLLADEVNRTPPKTQSALLESMEERQVSVGGETYGLQEPFMVCATQNPVEYEGTYPLPEAQLDRFMLKLLVEYPSDEQELDVVNRYDKGMDAHDVRASGVRAVANAADLAVARKAVAGLRCDPRVQQYLVSITRATRTSPSLLLGASPRGSIALLQAGKAWAWMQGRDFVTPDDVRTMVKPVLRHRVGLRPEVELDGATSDGVLDGILASVPVPR